MKSAVTRLQRHRARQREGRAVLSIEVDLFDHIEMLKSARLLQEWDDHSREAIEEATARLLRAMAEEE